MDRIIVEVDDMAAKKWRFASQEKRDQLNDAINRILQKALDKTEDDFWNFLNKVSENAEDKGLTEDKLNALLNE